MRFPRLSSVLLTFYAAARAARAARPAPLRAPLQGLAALRSVSPVPFLGSLFSSRSSAAMSHPDKRSDDEWRAVLSPEQFRILRQKGTEPPGSGKFDKHYPAEGVYACAGCGSALYRATHKFDSGCGWPAYFDSIPGAVTRHEDRSHFMARTEIVCSACGGHLGHVFRGEGFDTPTDERHCVNSVSLTFSPEDKPAPARGAGQEAPPKESKV